MQQLAKMDEPTPTEIWINTEQLSSVSSGNLTQMNGDHIQKARFADIFRFKTVKTLYM